MIIYTINYYINNNLYTIIKYFILLFLIISISTFKVFTEFIKLLPDFWPTRIHPFESFRELPACNLRPRDAGNFSLYTKGKSLLNFGLWLISRLYNPLDNTPGSKVSQIFTSFMYSALSFFTRIMLYPVFKFCKFTVIPCVNITS